MKILVVDDEKIKRVTLADDLRARGHDVVVAVDGEEALGKLETRPFDLVVTDLRMPRLDGIELLKRIKRGPHGDMRVIMMTAYGSIPIAVEAMKLGAFDFITKPFRNEDLFPLIARIEGEKEQGEWEQRGEASSAALDQAIVGRSTPIHRVKQMVEICSRTDANVLLCGETGVGKDLLASVIHKHSFRRRGPFVKVGCAAFPPMLIESALYGHEKGSFTGADQQRKGRFELADKGTLYLDDIDDIPWEQQAKLLRVIEEKVFERVGGATPIRANVRVIASTKRDLLEKISEGTFRQDLYYRLDVLRIDVPPLRHRLDDLPALVEHLLARIAQDHPCRIDSEAIDTLQRHDWPGNIRELYHTLERVYLVGAGHITADLLRAQMSGAAVPKSSSASGFRTAMEQIERQLLENALRTCAGNKSAAAASLGMKLSTFRDKLGKHGLL